MKIEIRDSSILIDGYVNVVGRDSRELRDASGVFVEQIAPGAFAESLTSGNEVGLMVNHQKTIGSTSDGLQLREDNVGLRATVEVSDSDVIAMAENGELRGWSFGFICKDDSWETRADGTRHRVVNKLDLKEVSILNKTPAYIATSIEARGEDEVLIEFRADALASENVDYSRAEKVITQTATVEEDEFGTAEWESLTVRTEVYKKKYRNR